MRFQKSFRLALNILLHSRLRSWLTILGIVIGVAAIVAILSIGEGAQAAMKQRLGGLGADIITVSSGFQRASFGFGGGGDRPTTTATTASTAKNLTERDIQVIKSVEGVEFVNGVISGRADMTYLAQTASVSVQGVDTQAWSNIVTTQLEQGRYLDQGDVNVIVVGYRTAKSTFKQQLALNRNVNIEGTEFKIVGILQQSGGFGAEDNGIIMPIAAARMVLENKQNAFFDSITVKVDNADQALQIANETDRRLMISRHVTSRTKDYSVSSAAAMQAQVESITQTFTIFLAAIAAVSLLVGAVGIANTMFTSVMEKTKEIGVMKAIGATNFNIMLIFMLNSGLVGLAGGIIGVAIGAGISAVLPNFIGRIPGMGGGGSISTVIPVSLLTTALLGSLLIGMIAGAIPAYRASKLKPVDALRYE